MADKKGFDLASVLGGVSDMNTGAEQIVLLDVDLLDPDPNNFYSLEGLDALAGNIELIGLQQPLRVRPSGERYTVVSGHRRRAAILLIRDGGSKQFATGVPCIVEYGEASEAMRELRLIYANSATRVLNSAELSKQAERVQELLYQLKEQGVAFPGRMRDHVAEACKISASKLARLHAIRANLDPDLLPHYDSGELREATAYALSKMPPAAQKACVLAHREKAAKLKTTGALKSMWEQTAVRFGEEWARLQEQKCPKDQHRLPCPCSKAILDRRFVDDSFWQCEGCCAKCSRLAECKRVCTYCVDKAAKLCEARKQARKNEKALLRSSEEMKIREIGLYWIRFGQALRVAGLSHKTLAKKMGRKEIRGCDESAVFNWSFWESDAEKLEAGCFDKLKPNTALPLGWSMSLSQARNLCSMAAALGVSLEYLFCLSDEPQGLAHWCREARTVEATLEERPAYWQEGEPPEEAVGWYAVLGEWADAGGIGPVREVLHWHDGAWHEKAGAAAAVEDILVQRWFPLPEEDEEG